MKYKELPIKWKKEAELMERNYCNVMLEEIEKESGICRFFNKFFKNSARKINAVAGYDHSFGYSADFG